MRSFFALLLSSWLLAGAARADYQEAYELLLEGRILPLSEILKRQENLHPGEVIEVELERRQDRSVYEVELLDGHGVVWEVYFDAATGQLIEEMPAD